MGRIAGALLVLAAAAQCDDTIARLAAAELGRSYDDALFRRAAASPEASVRRAAARSAGRMREPGATAWLLPLLADDVGPVRRSALFALGQVGSRDVVQPLLSALSSMPAAELPFALEALGKTGDARAVTAIARRLPSGEERTVVPEGPYAYLDHASPDVRGEAALALFRLRDPSALPDLVASLASEPEAGPRWRKVYAVWYLLRERARKAEAPVTVPDRWSKLLLASAAADRPFAERVFAIRALAAVAGARTDVAALLDDGDPRVVVAAVRATRKPWDADTAKRVARLVEHEDPLLREAALDHLLAGGEAAQDLLHGAALALAGEPRLQIRAVEALVEQGVDIEPAEDAADVDRRWIEEAYWRVNAWRPDRLEAKHLETVEGQRAAAEVCGTEKVASGFAAEVLLDLLRRTDFTVRTTAIESLAKRGMKRAADAILRAAKSAPGTADMDVRLAAIDALKTLEVHDPWLDEAARDPDRPVRDAARAALEALSKPVPPAPPAAGFRLHGHDAAGILEAARALRGAQVRFETTKGTFVAQLLPDEAPAHCVNLAVLVKRGFYTNRLWHRVVGNFVIQGGCPRGDGWGGPGYLLPDEIGSRTRYVRGTVGMPKAGDDTGGCQVFVTHLPTPHLDGRYTVFAQVIRGLAVVDRIRVGDRIVKATLSIAGQ